LRAVNLSEKAKPTLRPKQCSKAGFRLSGVKEDSAIRQYIQEHEIPVQAGRDTKEPALGEKK
jgi:hypothetical protein